jgi:hypothetical protein
MLGEIQHQGLTYFSKTPGRIAEIRKSRGVLEVIASRMVRILCVAFYYCFR